MPPKDAERLAKFFRGTLKAPLEIEDHGGLAKHYGCEMGDLQGTEPSVPITVSLLQLPHISSTGAELLYPPKKAGPMLITAIKDPDGNHVEFTQLDKSWIELLEKKRAEGNCLLRTFKKLNP